MKVKINGEVEELADATSLKELADAKGLPEKGVAIAVNNDMVTRQEWANRVLAEGDDIIIIRAVCGG